MGRPVRCYQADATYFVTARVIQGRLLLRPSTRTNELIGGVLARAARSHAVELYGFFFTSNHVHLLLRVRDGCLSAFMQFLLGNLARKLGHLVRWRGAFWERRFSAEPVFGDEAIKQRLRYIVAHGVKEGLVRRAVEWPGVSCVEQLLGSRKKVFRWFHWTLRWRGRRKSEDALDIFDDSLAEDIELELKPLPMWESLSDDARRAEGRALVDDIEATERKRHRAVLGVERILSQKPHHRPRPLNRTPRPLCHASSLAAWWSWREVYKAFLYEYRQASGRFRNGERHVSFPKYSFPPPLIAGITTALLAA